MLSAYLKGWFCKLGNNEYASYRHLFVVGTFAGHGMFKIDDQSDAKGSSLVAVDTFLKLAGKMPTVDTVVFLFAESNKTLFDKLMQNLEPYRTHALYVEWSDVNKQQRGRTKFTFRAINVAVKDAKNKFIRLVARNNNVPIFSFFDPFVDP